MNITIERFLSELEPGDTVDVNRFEDEHGVAMKRELLDELEGRGFVLDSKGVLGEVEICSRCDGDGICQNEDLGCGQCDGYGTTINQGKGQRPFRP